MLSKLPVLPKRLASLDIETIRTSFRRPEKSKVVVAGVRFYEMGKKGYVSKGYRAFLEHQISDLETRLKEFEGVIIGHNILQFDYRVLGTQINLEGIIEKTVDTLAVLYKRNRYEFKGLSLDSLARINLGKFKSFPGERVATLWENGDHQTVIDYNKNDCALTKELWFLMLKQQHVLFDPNDFRRTSEIQQQRIDRGWPWPADSYQHDGCRKISLTKRDLSILAGQQPFLTFSAWQESIKKEGHAFKKRIEWEYRELNVDGAGLDPEVPVVFHKMICLDCFRNFLLVTKIDRLLYCDEKVECLWCGCAGELGKMHRGAITEGLKNFGDGTVSTAGLHGPKVIYYRYRAKGILPQEARKYISRLRDWSERKIRF